MKKETPKCQRCGKHLPKGARKSVMLELDQRTGTFTNQPVPHESSQGGFFFGANCAKIVLAEHEKKVRS